MNIEQLSNAELVKILQTLEQQENALNSDKLALYHPHEGQVDFHSNSARIRLLVTGNRFGKTTASVIEAIWLATGTHPYHSIPVPNTGKLYGQSFPTIMETIAPKFEQWCSASYLDNEKPYTYDQRGNIICVNFKNGSRIKIGSYDQQDIKAEGSSWHYVGFDEPPSRELYVGNLRGCVDHGGLMWFSATPLAEPWIYDDLWLPGITGSKPYIHCISGQSDSNPYINKEALSLFVGEMTDSEKEVRFYGKFTSLRGLVIDTYQPALSDIDPFNIDENFCLYEGIDPHPAKPNAALWKAIDPAGYRFVVAELSCDAGITTFAREVAIMRRRLTENGAILVASVADSSLNQDDLMFKMNQYEEFKNILAIEGEVIMPQIAHKRGWLDAGISKLKDLYRPAITELASDPIPRQYVFKTCKKYRYELLHYQWPKEQRDSMKPIAKHNEYLDCDRYIESIAPTYRTPGAQMVYSQNNPNAYRRIRPGENKYSQSEQRIADLKRRFTPENPAPTEKDLAHGLRYLGLI